MPKASSNSQTQMPSSPSSAGTPEPEKSQQPRPSAIMLSILTRMGSERARPRETGPPAPPARRAARAGKATAAAAGSHHAGHPHPYGVGESAAQGDEPVHPSLRA